MTVPALIGGVRSSAPVADPTRSAIREFAQRHSVLLACLTTLAVHLMSLTRQLGVDEGGFATIARYARSGGPYLYGPTWVDRPPGLIAVFSLADQLGPFGVRLLAAVFAVMLVSSVAAGAEALGGRTSARWAAWSGFALSSSVLLGAERLTGELIAGAFVALSVAAVLCAVVSSTTWHRTLLAGGVAGAAAMCAVLVKQNFLDAFVFAAVLLGLGLLTRSNRLIYRPARVLTTAGGFLAGATIPVAVALRWAVLHGGLGALAYAMVGFRRDAAGVMAHWSLHAPLQRLGVLTLAACLSGLLLMVGHLAIAHRRRLRQLTPLPWALAATASLELLGVVAGENFWSHYLIAFIPMVALAAGLAVHHRMPGATWTRRLVVLTVVLTALSAPVLAIHAASTPREAYTTGRWVASSAHTSDTLSVTWTHANVINASGLRPGYAYAWSLPPRTLDPHLDMLVDTLSGPTATAPTWVVRWDPPHSWGLDSGNRVDGALRAHYRNVASVCGRQVWLHDGVHRELAPGPAAAACGVGAR